MEAKKIEVTQEMLERALLCCLDNEPADHYPCEDCYLYPRRGADDDCMPDGTVCSKRLAQDAIAYIRRINDFEKSQCAHLLVRLEELKRRYDEINRYNISCTKEIDKLLVEKATLKKALRSMAMENFELYKQLSQAKEEVLSPKLTVENIIKFHTGRPDWEYEQLSHECDKSALEQAQEQESGAHG